MQLIPWQRFQQRPCPENQVGDAEPAVSAIENVGPLPLCNIRLLGGASVARRFAWFTFSHKSSSNRVRLGSKAQRLTAE